MTTPLKQKPEKAPVSKHTLWLRRGDMGALREKYSLGASKVIRTIVAQFVDANCNSVTLADVESIAATEKESP